MLIGASFYFLIALIVVIIVGITTKKWDKAGYILSAFLFLIAFISSMNNSGMQVETYLQNVLSILSLGFLVLSLTFLLPKKK